MTVSEFEDMLTMASCKYAGYEIKNAHFTARNVTAGRNFILDRKTAASIIHEFLLDILEETDNSDVGPALELADIYDCRVCTAHIAQVYCKGIMDSGGSGSFGLSEEVTETEAKTYMERIFETDKRITVKDISGDNTEEKNTIEKISVEKCRDILSADRSAILIDVRNHAEYENGHFDNAVNIPMDAVIKNPYGVSNNKDARLMLWCEGGSRSETAARCLIEAGYKHVFVVNGNV
ncbi:MAG: rhodanese-like domain-containing protein [Lachnospiraceae bacterium]|nr:rhodanese-like domain-containing protein [Lachnospiraceae bacterium]